MLGNSKRFGVQLLLPIWHRLSICMHLFWRCLICFTTKSWSPDVTKKDLMEGPNISHLEHMFNLNKTITTCVKSWVVYVVQLDPLKPLGTLNHWTTQLWEDAHRATWCHFARLIRERREWWSFLYMHAIFNYSTNSIKEKIFSFTEPSQPLQFSC